MPVVIGVSRCVLYRVLVFSNDNIKIKIRYLLVTKL